jgi:cytidylate kinase
MIITVGGSVASGKSTLARKIAARYGLPCHSVGKIMRDMASERGISLQELGARAEKDPSIDREIDDRQRELAKGDCVVDSRLGAFFLATDLKIWLTAPIEVRIKRMMERDGIKRGDAMRGIQVREKSERKRYSEIYDIDLSDLSIYDLVINTGNLTQDETLGICAIAIDALK